VISGAEELRHKESDRISVMVAGLRSLGIDIEERPDGAVIHGGALSGGEVDSAGDHRIAMAFAVAGIVAQAPIRILNTANVATSFPEFADHAQAIGMNLEIIDG
jgi:3-phosphoshikimate 1-carboxyvinyltransferase